MSDLKHISDEDLINELISRFDHAAVIGVRGRSNKRPTSSKVHWAGDDLRVMDALQSLYRLVAVCNPLVDPRLLRESVETVLREDNRRKLTRTNRNFAARREALAATLATNQETDG